MKLTVRKSCVVETIDESSKFPLLNCGDIIKWKLAELPGCRSNVSYSN